MEIPKKKVYKYTLNPTQDIQVIELPIESQILTAQMQGNSLQLWALVNPEQKIMARRSIEIVGTGHICSSSDDSEKIYISTIQLMGGALIYHIFEIK